VLSKTIDEKPDEYAPVLNRAFQDNYGFTILDRQVGHHRVTNLSYHWPFVDEKQAYVDYRQVYRPVSVIDSMAFHVMASQDESLTESHLKLAKLFEERNDFWNAFREYNALTKINPYWSPYFRKAADCLLKLADLPRAFRYYERSLEYDESFYARYRMGEILMLKNDVSGAIRQFEQALALAGEERIQVLAKLHTAYAYLGDREKMNRVRKEIASIRPGQKLTVPPRSYLYLNYVPARINNFIVGADSLAALGQTEAAQRLLQESIDVLDTPIAHRKLGEELYRVRKPEEALTHLLRVSDEYFFDPAFLSFMVLLTTETADTVRANTYREQLRRVAPAFENTQDQEKGF
ncbi:MAG TPA: hypothetical protein PLK12_17640, partial [Prolixibacteraceae bacterium]|nr:hypothetical protein [Prolixibacteraceae bacterium]